MNSSLIKYIHTSDLHLFQIWSKSGQNMHLDHSQIHVDFWPVSLLHFLSILSVPDPICISRFSGRLCHSHGYNLRRQFVPVAVDARFGYGNCNEQFEARQHVAQRPFIGQRDSGKILLTAWWDSFESTPKQILARLSFTRIHFGTLFSIS